MAAIISFDFSLKLINIAHSASGSTGPLAVTVADLRDAIRSAEASEQGILSSRIINASGRNQLSASTQTALTIELLGWQLKFNGFGYLAQIEGGNLIGGISGDPFADHAGISVLNVLAQAATIVQVSGGGTFTNADRQQLNSLPGATDIASAVLDTDI